MGADIPRRVRQSSACQRACGESGVLRPASTLRADRRSSLIVVKPSGDLRGESKASARVVAGEIGAERTIDIHVRGQGLQQRVDAPREGLTRVRIAFVPLKTIGCEALADIAHKVRRKWQRERTRAAEDIGQLQREPAAPCLKLSRRSPRAPGEGAGALRITSAR